MTEQRSSAKLGNYIQTYQPQPMPDILFYWSVTTVLFFLLMVLLCMILLISESTPLSPVMIAGLAVALFLLSGGGMFILAFCVVGVPAWIAKYHKLKVVIYEKGIHITYLQQDATIDWKSIASVTVIIGNRTQQGELLIHLKPAQVIKLPYQTIYKHERMVKELEAHLPRKVKSRVALLGKSTTRKSS